MSSALVDCPLCGAQPARLWARDRWWRVYECRRCRLRLTWPRPSASELEHSYGEQYYEGFDMGKSAAPAWHERCQGILSLLPERPEAALDWGAGAGHFVAALRQLGVRAEGVETSTAGRAMARGLHDVELATAPPFGGRYDLITFIHSLEHMDDPVLALQHARASLARGGKVFIEVPHAGSFEMWRPAVRRRILDLPRHLFHFTPETLVRIVEAAGLRTVEIRLFNPEWLEYLGRLLRGRGRSRPPRESVVATTSIAGRGGAPLAGRAAAVRKVCPGWKFQLLAEEAR